jgi:RNA polymerase primary sigma factor
LLNSEFVNIIKQNPLLTKRQEIDLARKVKKGDERARKKLIESNYRLVISIAKKYHRNDINFEDLVQESSIGLIKAVDKFNPELGHKFSTYACWWIKQSALQYINENMTNIKVPTHSRLLNAKIKKAADHLEKKLGVTPSVDDIAKDLGETVKKIKYTIKANKKTTSIDSLSDDENKSSNILNRIEDDSVYTDPAKCLEMKELNQIIRQSLSLLTPKEEKIIRLRFGIDEINTDKSNFKIDNKMMEYLNEK